MIQGAINNGFTFAWAADVSEKGFKFKEGLAIVPEMPFSEMSDAEKAAYKAFGLTSLPCIVVIDKDGNVKLKQEGFDPDQADPFGDVGQMISSLTK